MCHRLQQKVLVGKKKRTSLLQDPRTPSTFTIGKNPHLTKNNRLHSKSTYFYRWGSRKNKLNTNLSSRLSYVVPSVCALALLVGGIIAINPILSNVEKASAEGEPIAQANTTPTVSLTLTSGEAYQQTTAEVGKIAYRSNIFQISGSNIGEYTVTLNTANGETGKLVGMSNPYSTIGKVDAGTSPVNFKNNTWGYAVSTLNNTNTDNSTMTYYPVPSGIGGSNSTILAERKIIRTNTITDQYKITFAANLSNDLPSDHYRANVYLSVVASPVVIFDGITTMQEMTSTICNQSPEHETKQLKDTRDNKPYWVSKLKDGNCWMTQNLDYDGVGIQIDSIEDWTTGNKNTITNTTSAYYNPDQNLATGQAYYYNGPLDSNGQPTHSQGDPCKDANATDNYTVIGLSNCNQFSTTTIENNANTHYLVGNYYSWPAATDTNLCPKGWRLPTSGNNTGEFRTLLSTYGWTSALGSTADNTMNNNKGIYGAPLFFVYSGRLTSGHLLSAGSFGSYWSSTPNTSNSNFAYILWISGSVGPSYDTYTRTSGTTVRCVAE